MRLAVIAPDSEIAAYEQAAARTNGIFELSHFVTDLASTAGIDALLGKASEFDACVMLSPNSVSRSQIDQLAAAGKHLLSNPHHTTPEFLDQIAEKWKTADAHHAVAQPRRFSPYSQAIRDGVVHDQLGNPGLLRIHHWGSQKDVAAELRGGSEQAWIRQTLVDEIDLACWLFGCQPEMVYSQFTGVRSGPGSKAGSQDSSQDAPQASSQDGVSAFGLVVHLGFENGGMALIDVALHPAKAFYAATLVGAHGAAYADDHHNTNLLLQEQTHGISVANDLAKSSWLRPQLESFVQAATKGETDQSLPAMQLAMLVGHTAMSTCANNVARWNGDRYELQ